MIRVLVFGTFDGVHEGHRNMLRQAKQLGDYLVVCVAADNVVEEMKGKTCVSRSARRIQMVRDERIADEVVLGDKLLGNWSVIKRYKPDIIALGYDQDELKEALDAHFENSEKRPRMVMLKPFKPELFKSSLLNQ